MKKNKKIIKLSKIKKKDKNLGFGALYKNKVLALLGKKTLQNKNSYNLDYKLAIINQNKAYLVLKQAESKILITNISNTTYKGVRLKLKLPVRGQRTHTNAQTARKLNKINE